MWYNVDICFLKNQENFKHKIQNREEAGERAEQSTTDKSKSFCTVLILKLGSGSLEHIFFFIVLSTYLCVTHKLVYISNNQQIRKTEIQPIKMNCVESQTSNQ